MFLTYNWPLNANKEDLTNDELFGDSPDAIADVIDMEELKNELEKIPVHIKP